MTEDELCAAGTAAENLLNAEVFTSTINELVDTTFQNFVNTVTDESDKREDAYRTYRAVVDIVNTLRQKVAVRDEIDQKNKPQIIVED